MPQFYVSFISIVLLSGGMFADTGISRLIFFFYWERGAREERVEKCEVEQLHHVLQIMSICYIDSI